MGGRDKTIAERQAKWVENQKDRNRARLQGYISSEAKDLIFELVKECQLPNQGAVIEHVLFEWLKLQQTGGDELGQTRLDQLRQENNRLQSKLQQVTDERDDLEAQLAEATNDAGVKELIKKWKAKAETASGPRWAQLKNFLDEYEKLFSDR